ncbi:MAG: UbiA family prenyltransferase [Myxococcales bacterium]|jgi:4-hydroxybenzoate polyprenyltransferase
MKLDTALRLGRVSNLPTTWTNVLAGLSLAGVSPGLDLGLGLALAISLFYVGGMYLNDAFDREIDAVERPERPIPSGQVSAATVFGLGFGMLGGGVALVAGLAFLRPDGAGLPPVLAALGLAATIVFYDAFHKRNPLSPLVMGLTRVLVYVTAALSARGAFTDALWLGCGALLCYLIGLTYVAKQENLRELRGVWPLIFLAAPFASAVALGDEVSVGMYLLFGGWVAYTLGFILSPARRNIPRAVGQFIAGISLLDGLLVAVQGRAALAGFCLLGFALTRLLQRRIPGT